jgi:hypothetical protein
MRAKRVNENISFERGNDPKKSMGIGIKDYEDYIKIELHKKYPDKDIQDLEIRFWESFYDGFQEEKGYAVAKTMMDILKHTPLEYQIEWIKGDLEMFDSWMSDEEDENYFHDENDYENDES